MNRERREVTEATSPLDYKTVDIDDIGKPSTCSWNGFLGLITHGFEEGYVVRGIDKHKFHAAIQTQDGNIVMTADHMPEPAARYLLWNKKISRTILATFQSGDYGHVK